MAPRMDQTTSDTMHYALQNIPWKFFITSSLNVLFLSQTTTSATDELSDRKEGITKCFNTVFFYTKVSTEQATAINPKYLLKLENMKSICALRVREVHKWIANPYLVLPLYGAI